MDQQRLPSLDGVAVMPRDVADATVLRRAAERCKTATRAARAIRAAGVPGRVETDPDGVLSMHGSDWDRVEWRDARAKGGFLQAEHWATIPEGREGAGDSLRMIQLRWPVLSRPGTFMPADLFDLSSVFMAGWRVCSLAAEAHDLPPALMACETVLRGALGPDHLFEFATPWSPTLLGVEGEPGSEATDHDAALVALVASRSPPCVEVRILGGDDYRIVVTPRPSHSGFLDRERPGMADLMRAVAEVEALPVLRDGAARPRGRRATH